MIYLLNMVIFQFATLLFSTGFSEIFLDQFHGSQNKSGREAETIRNDGLHVGTSHHVWRLRHEIKIILEGR